MCDIMSPKSVTFCNAQLGLSEIDFATKVTCRKLLLEKILFGRYFGRRSDLFDREISLL